MKYTNEQRERIFKIHRKHSDRYKLGWSDKSIYDAIAFWDGRND